MVLVIGGVVASTCPMLLFPDGIGMRVSNACYRWWSRVSLRLFGVRVFVVGREHLAGRPCVIVANHRSHLDVPVLGTILEAPVCTVYKRSLARIPFLGFALWLSRSVGIDRDDPRGSREQMDTVAGRLEGGRSILVFPEGARSRGVALSPFKKGAAVMAIQQAVDIVPVTIIGTDELYPPGRLMVNSGTALVVIHPRQVVSGTTWEDRGKLNRRMQEMVGGAFCAGAPGAMLPAGAERVI